MLSTKQLLDSGTQRFLRFAVGERNYEYCRLPFGYALAPRTSPSAWRRHWSRSDAQGEVAVSHTHWVLSHIQRLGFMVNREKSRLQPAQRMIYLGLQLDSVTFRAALSVGRRRNITRLAREVLAGPRVPARRLRSLLGMMAAAHAVVRLGLSPHEEFQRWFSRLRLHPSRDGGRLIWVPQEAASDIRFWLTPGLLRDGVTLACAMSHVEVFTDASLEGWGGVLGQSSIGGCWSDSARHINLLEMEAVHRVLLHFAPQLQGRHVMVRSDNTTVVSYLNRQGGTRSPALHRMATVTLLWAALHLLSLRARHVPGVRNVGADRMSRGGPLQDEWGLAPRVAAEFWRRFGRPVVDLFASAENAQGPAVCLPTSASPAGPAAEDRTGEEVGDPGGSGQSACPVVPLPEGHGGDGALGPPGGAGGSSPGGGGSPVFTPDNRPQALGSEAERRNLVDLGLPPAVLETIQGARAPSTVRAYATRWRLFSDWCGSCSWDPRRCPLEGVLGFLQELFDKGRAVATLAVFAAAITSGGGPRFRERPRLGPQGGP
uniref:Reverse transcriptase RNase H-like domain-containing protein n=1 Tax=Knipowitschia caucasica TaxID=637954 RepID=A0AAV2KY84_KNICA